MATNRQIHGKVVLDVETEGESAAIAELREKFSALTATVQIGVKFPTRKVMQAQLNAEAMKGGGLKLFIDELNLPGKKEMQAQVNKVSGKDANGLKLHISSLDLPAKAVMQKQLDAKVGAGLKLHVLLDVTNKSFLPVIAAQKAAQKALTDLEAKELAKRETARINSQTRTAEREKLISSKGDQDRLTSKARTVDRIRVLEEQAANIIERNQAASALRREVIEAQLASRLEAQNNAFQQRRVLAQERIQRQLEARANKPIIQRFLINADAVNQSLTDFDRTVSRFLKTSLVAFTAWSAGVEIAFAAAAIAGVAAFAQLEQASTRAASVVASQQRVDEIEKYGRAVTNFGDTTAAARLKIEAVAQRVALQTLFDPTEVAAGIQQLLQSGQTAEEAFKNIGAAANFATVNNKDLLETSEGLATSLASAGISADESALLLDKISLTAQAAVGDVDDYFKAFANGAGAAGRIIGATTDETLFVLRLLGQAGTLGLEAGTSADIVFRDLGKAAIKAGDAWAKYGINATGTIGEQLVGLAGVIEATGGNRIAQAKLRKELGFQEKSFRAISRILPQVTSLGANEAERLAAINRELGSTAKGAKGLVDLQLGELKKNVAFQFDQLKDSFVIAFQEFGRGAAEATSDLFDVFAGAGGLLDQALPSIQEFGRQFGAVIEDMVDFIQTPAFQAGIDNLVEAVQVTLGGVAEAFGVFSGAFDDAQGKQSVFESVTESILAFARVSANVLPAIARILGTIFDFLIDNADAFETFAKLTLGLFAARKAYSLLIKPLGEAVLLIGKFTAAVKLSAATGAGGAILGALASLATRMGIITATTTAATTATLELVAAQTALSASSTAAAATSALGPIPAFPGRGFNKNAVSARGIGDSGRRGVDELATGAIIADTALQARNTKAFDGITKAMSKAAPAATKLGGPIGKLLGLFGKLIPTFIKASPAIARIGGALAKFAGPVGLAILAFEALIGVFKGFFEEINRGKDGSGEFGNTLKELQPVFDALIEGGKFLLDILAVVGRVGKSIGRLLGAIVVDIITNLGDGVRGIKLLFEGDLIGALKAFGDIIVNVITLPFRLAIGAIIDLVADVLDSLKRIDKLVPGTPIKDAADATRGAAAATRDWRLNMSEAEEATKKTSIAVKDVDINARAAALGVGATKAELEKAKLTADQLKVAVGGTFKAMEIPAATAELQTFSQAVGGFQAQIDVTSSVAAQAWGEQQLQAALAKDKLADFGAATANAFGGIYDGLRGIESGSGFAATQVGGIEGAFRSLESAAAGSAANMIQNLSTVGQQAAIVSAQISQAAGEAIALATAQLPAGQTLDIGQQGIITALAAQPILNPELTRRTELLRVVEQQRADQAFLKEALPEPVELPPLATPAGTGGGARAEFVDPDEVIRKQIDALKPARKAAETSAAISKALAAGEKGYAATRREVILFEDALPGLDKALESQRAQVEKLDAALSDLQSTQVKGSKAFSDAQFAIEQQQKALQLQKLDLEIGGAAEGDPALVAIDDQLKALQQQAERSSLVEALELDPLRRKLEETFNPTTEASFASIIQQFKELTASRATANTQLEATQRTQALISAAAEAGSQKFGKLDEAAQKVHSALQQATAGSTRTATAISGVATSSGVAARNVNKYSKAVEGVPSGKGVVDKSLAGINKRVTELAEQFNAEGKRVMVFFTQGVNQSAAAVLYPALAVVVGNTLTYMRSIAPPAQSIGKRVMDSFLAGLKDGFGSPEKVGSIAWYLNVFIPKWIVDNKGPVAYDAQILVPAGQAVMEGFGTGLRSGFSQIQAFVKDVGPSLKEFVTGTEFSDRTATIMADIAIGRTPDIEGAFGDLRLAATPGAFGGVADPALSFLHPTLSLADTIQQAFGIVKALGGGLNTGGSGQISRPDGTTTSSGNISAHTEGTAADIGTSTSHPTAASLELFAKAKAMLGTIFRQIIHNGTGLNAGGGSFGDSQHFDHVHLEWIKGLGFSENSGKIGAPPVIDIPGASPIVDQAINAAAKKWEIELAVLAGLFKQESGFNPNVISADGGYGLAQLTSAGLLRQVGFNRLDPFKNADVGAGYLKGMLNKYGNVPDAVGAYNAGSKPFPSSTINSHIPKVMAYIEEFRRIFGTGSFGGFRELGGSVRAGKNYVVGEGGPEIFTPTRSGAIIPNGDSEAILSGKGGRSMAYHDNRSIQVTTAATDAEAVAALVDARTRVRFTGVNFR